MVVFGVVVIMISAVVSTMLVINAKMEDLKETMDRTIAQYACEAGASIAVMDISLGHIGSKSGQWTTKTFDYAVGNRTCKVTYVVTRNAGVWTITVTVPSPMGFKITYTLRVGGRRAFPFFIKGPGPMM